MGRNPRWLTNSSPDLLGTSQSILRFPLLPKERATLDVARYLTLSAWNFVLFSQARCKDQ